MVMCAISHPAEKGENVYLYVHFYGKGRMRTWNNNVPYNPYTH